MSEEELEKTPVWKVVVKTPQIIGLFVAGGVIGLVGLSLLFGTIKRRHEQYKLRKGLKAFNSALYEPADRKQKTRERARRAISDLAGVEGFEVRGALALQRNDPDRALKTFEHYAQVTAKSTGAPASAWLGVASAALAQIEKDPASRGALLDKARKAIDKAGETNPFAAGVLKGAVALVENDAARALGIYDKLAKALDEPVDADQAPDRETLVAFYWNRGLAQLLLRKPESADNICRAMQYRTEWPDATRALVVAIQISLENASGEAELAERIKFAQTCLGQRVMIGTERRLRYGFTREDSSAILNSIGIAQYDLKRYEEAVDSFRTAGRWRKNDLVTTCNLATAAHFRSKELSDLLGEKFQIPKKDRARGPFPTPPEAIKNDKEKLGAWRKEMRETRSAYVRSLETAANAFRRGSEMAEKRDERFKLLLFSAYYAMKAKKYAIAEKYMLASEKLGVNVAEAYRVLGVLHFEEGPKNMVKARNYFLKAIEAGHPESPRLRILAEAIGN